MWFHDWLATTDPFGSDRAASYMSPIFDLTHLQSRFNAGVSLAQSTFFWVVSFLVASWQDPPRRDTPEP